MLLATQHGESVDDRRCPSLKVGVVTRGTAACASRGCGSRPQVVEATRRIVRSIGSALRNCRQRSGRAPRSVARRADATPAWDPGASEPVEGAVLALEVRHEGVHAERRARHLAHQVLAQWNGADRVGYPSIVGSGPNGTTLHYDVNRRQTRDGDLVVIDAGAETDPPTRTSHVATASSAPSEATSSGASSGASAPAVAVTVPPENGKTNEAVIALLAKTFRLAKSSMRITGGASARRKTLLIAGDARELETKLAECIKPRDAA